MGALGIERARPRAIREHRLAPWLAVGAVCFGAFMGQLDASIVALAFPALQRQYGTGLAQVQWVSLAYLLTLVALLAPVGRWSDRWGRKLVYLYGFAVFTAASGACGLASSLTWLIAVRVVQAVGAAMLQANSVALVVTSVPEGRRRSGLGVQAGAQAMGLAVGPTLGGVLVSSVGWRWVFLTNVPVGVVALVAGWFLLPRTRHRAASTGIDLVGVLLLATVSVGLLLFVSAVSGRSLPGQVLAACTLVAIAAAAGLVWWERRAADPVLDLRLLTGPVRAGLAGALAAYLVLFGPLVLYPQALIDRGDSALRAGLLLTALPAGFGLAAVAADRGLPGAWPNGRRSLTGGLIGAAVAAAAAVAGPGSAVATTLLLGLLGLGLGIYIPANNTAIMAAIPESRAAIAGGLVNMTRGLGTALGVAVVTLALHMTARHGHPGAGFPVSLAVLAMVALLAGLTALADPVRPVVRTDHGDRR